MSVSVGEGLLNMSPITQSPICSSVDRCLWASVSLNECLCLCVYLSLSSRRLCTTHSVCHVSMRLLPWCFASPGVPHGLASYVFRHLSRRQSLKGLFLFLYVSVSPTVYFCLCVCLCEVYLCMYPVVFLMSFFYFSHSQPAYCMCAV